MKFVTRVGSLKAADASVRAGAGRLLLNENTPEDVLLAILDYARPKGIRTVLDYRRTLPDAATAARAALLTAVYQGGLDEVMVGDVGTLRMAGLTAPDCVLCWGAPCSLLSDLRFAKAQNCGAALLSPFLSPEEIQALLSASPLPLWLTVYDALCPAGDPALCLLRDADNPAYCKEACRGLYGHGDKAEAPLLWARDVDITRHLHRFPTLDAALICPPDPAPEVAAALTAHGLLCWKNGENPFASKLFRALGRPRPSDAVLTGGDGLFVSDSETVPPKQHGYWQKEQQKLDALPLRKTVPVTFFVLVEEGEPVRLAVDDGEGHTHYAEGDPPRPSRNEADSVRAGCSTVCYQCGGVYDCISVHTRLRGDVEADPAHLAVLRDKALEQLTQARRQRPVRTAGQFRLGEVLLPREEAPVFTVKLRHLHQLSGGLTARRPACLYLPLAELAAAPDTVRALLAEDQCTAAVLPRVVTEGERDSLTEQLERVRELGITEALVWSPGQMLLAARAGFGIRADWGMAGSQCLKAAKKMNFLSCTLASWLRFSEIANISHVVPTELVVYGRLPLLLSRRCLIRPKSGLCACENHHELCHADGAHSPLLRECAHSNTVYHAQKLWLMDCAAEWRHIGLWAGRLDFTTENALETVRIVTAYGGQSPYVPHAFTHGFYTEPEPPPKPVSGLARLFTAARRKSIDN